jgi:hypothetical protein
MWQAVIVLILIAAVLVYVVRHYARMYRCGSSACTCCSSGCSMKSVLEKLEEPQAADKKSE